MLDQNLSLAEKLAALPIDQRMIALDGIDTDELLWDWHFWGRPSQFAPDTDWLTWMILAGRGFGKTRSGAEWVRNIACGLTPETPGIARRIALVGETRSDVRKVMVEGESGILAVHPPEFKPEWIPSIRTLIWPNGCVATTYNASEPDELRGPQFDHAWCDELAKWRYVRETWDNLEFAMRLGDRPRSLITTTPRPIPLVRELLDESTTTATRGSMLANKSNLPDTFIKKIMKRYDGTRLGRQEIDGELVEDIDGALWPRNIIENARIREVTSDLIRIVIGVDPSGSSAGTGDDTGIIAVGMDDKDHFYVLADWSLNGSPEKWASKAIACANEFQADRIIAESNYGGEMVRSVINSCGSNIPVKLVHASRGKVKRAEPIAALYEQGRVHHVGGFSDLEDQMCGLVLGGEYYGPGKSPDRADALVWSLTELSASERSEPSIRSL